MDVYIDLGNLSSYARSIGGDSVCNQMLKENFVIKFTFAKSQIERQKKQVKSSIMALMKNLTRGRGSESNILWSQPCPLRASGDYSSLSKEELMSVYMTEDEELYGICQDGCLLIARVGEEVKVLKSLFIDNQPIPTREYSSREMKDWSLIKDNASPCTDIIFIDPYLFIQSDNLYEKNSYKIVEHLCEGVKNKKVNIVFFTYSKDVPYKTIERNLKLKIVPVTGVEPYITFVKLPQREEHDRTILTNYKKFASGNSFTYFDRNEENISTGRNFYVNSLVDRRNQRQALSYISDLQELVDKLKVGLDSITGDRKSFFLNLA